MKLAGREAARFLARPDDRFAGVLLFGADPMRVALKRAALVAALIGPDGGADMRLTRIAGAELRRDPAALIDATQAMGFFAGAARGAGRGGDRRQRRRGARGARRTGRRATRGSW